MQPLQNVVLCLEKQCNTSHTTSFDPIKRKPIYLHLANHLQRLYTMKPKVRHTCILLPKRTIQRPSTRWFELPSILQHLSSSKSTITPKEGDACRIGHSCIQWFCLLQSIPLVLPQLQSWPKHQHHLQMYALHPTQHRVRHVHAYDALTYLAELWNHDQKGCLACTSQQNDQARAHDIIVGSSYAWHQWILGPFCLVKGEHHIKAKGGNSRADDDWITPCSNVATHQ